MCKYSYIVLLSLCIKSTELKAQEPMSQIIDGPVLQSDDSLSARSFPNSRMIVPQMTFFLSPSVIHPAATLMIPSFETKEQRAQKINFRTSDMVRKSVAQNLYWYRVPKMSESYKRTLRISKMLISNPYGFPEGCIPLMNTSFPFIYAKIPGWAPYEVPSATEQIPKCIETEYDIATGTYKQVMVDWSEVQRGMQSNK